VIRSELRRSARPPQEQPGEKPAAETFGQLSGEIEPSFLDSVLGLAQN
jgi:hypothetical protein